MPNVDVKKALEQIAGEMWKLERHVTLYSGVSKKEAKNVLQSLHTISSFCDLIAKHAEKPV